MDPDCDPFQNGKKRKLSNSEAPNTRLPTASLFDDYPSVSANKKTKLVIKVQPEEQHRARYQTEGSRGAVKDREANGHPTVQLVGYPRKANLILQVFIGCDQGKPIPNLSYQACKVTGKNSTPCTEMKLEGTDVMLVDMDHEKDYVVVCDCVGILKERQSDIQLKKPQQKQRVNWKQKTTCCRMVFRTEIENDDGEVEILQVVSDPIDCVQQPGTPEISKMSRSSCPVVGQEELWMIGKNFQKDSVVLFQLGQDETDSPFWTQTAYPDKDYFHQTHLVVVIPAFMRTDIQAPVEVMVYVRCGDKYSDGQRFRYTPVPAATPAVNGVVSNGVALKGKPTILEPIDTVGTKEEHGVTRHVTLSQQEASRENIELCEDTIFEVSDLSRPRQHRYSATAMDTERSTTEDGSRVKRGHEQQPASSSFLPYREETSLLSEMDDRSNLGLTLDSTIDEPSSSLSNGIQDAVDISRPFSAFSSQQQPASSTSLQQTWKSNLLKNSVPPLALNNGNIDTKDAVMHKSPPAAKQSPGEPLTNYIDPAQQSRPVKLEEPTGEKVFFEKKIAILESGCDDATISFKLPQSIIRDRECFENVVRTINKSLLLTPSTVEDDPPAPVATEDPHRVLKERKSIEEEKPSDPLATLSPAPIPQQHLQQHQPILSSSYEENPKKQKISDSDEAAAFVSSWLQEQPKQSKADLEWSASAASLPVETNPLPMADSAQTWNAVSAMEDGSKLNMVWATTTSTTPTTSWGQATVVTTSWSTPASSFTMPVSMAAAPVMKTVESTWDKTVDSQWTEKATEDDAAARAAATDAKLDAEWISSQTDWPSSSADPPKDETTWATSAALKTEQWPDATATAKEQQWVASPPAASKASEWVASSTEFELPQVSASEFLATVNPSDIASSYGTPMEVDPQKTTTRVSEWSTSVSSATEPTPSEFVSLLHQQSVVVAEPETASPASAAKLETPTSSYVESTSSCMKGNPLLSESSVVIQQQQSIQETNCVQPPDPVYHEFHHTELNLQ